AQVSGACNLDPLVVREGKEQLFEERYYRSVFPNSDPDYYLPRYWLGKYATKLPKGYPERGKSKWLLLYFLWPRLARHLGTRALKLSFRSESEKGAFPALARCLKAAFGAASIYYRANRGSGAQRTDASNFYKRTGHHTEFEKFWRHPANRYKRR